MKRFILFMASPAWNLGVLVCVSMLLGSFAADWREGFSVGLAIQTLIAFVWTVVLAVRLARLLPDEPIPSHPGRIIEDGR